MTSTIKTRRVAIRLAALTRVEYYEVLEVPADLSDDELNNLVNLRYGTIDGSEFIDDPEFWERSNSCGWEPADAGSLAIGRVSRTPQGRLVVEEFSAAVPPEARPAKAPAAAAWPAPAETAQSTGNLREQRDALLRVYRSMQARLKVLDRPGWAHDYDDDLRAAGVQL